MEGLRECAFLYVEESAVPFPLTAPVQMMHTFCRAAVLIPVANTDKRLYRILRDFLKHILTQALP